MVDTINFYIDDSGTRHPDKKPGRVPSHGNDYFSLGGILIDGSEEEQARNLYDEFCTKWEINYPLHSVEIRGKNKNFSWLGKIDKKTESDFYEELYQLMKTLPVKGLACVIDRPGYNARYREIHGRERWSLCRTAFGISVERACKYALNQNKKLRVLPEKASKTDDGFLKKYYAELKSSGHQFNSGNSSLYEPLNNKDFDNALYELRFKEKSSPMAQIADLYLWPMCLGGYNKNNRPYARLVEDKKLLDCYLSEEKIGIEGIKYSCFEKVEIKH